VKIDVSRSEIPTDAPDSAGRPATQDPGAPEVTSTTSDEVSPSSDARLMQTVMQDAQEALDVRQDVVERMRAALAKGKVGNEPHALADALLDRLLGTSSRKQP